MKSRDQAHKNAFCGLSLCIGRPRSYIGLSAGFFQWHWPVAFPLAFYAGMVILNPLFILAGFIAIPMIEIGLFISIGGAIGLIPTLGIVIATALIGTALLRRQGLSVLARARMELNSGKMPLAEIADGVFLLVAAVLLLTPGFMTDAFGFLLFVPAVRQTIGKSILATLNRSDRVHMQTPDGRTYRTGPDIVDGEAQEIDPDEIGPRSP